MLALEDYLSGLYKIWTDVHDRLMKLAEANRQRADKIRRKSNISPGDNVLKMVGYNATKLEWPPGMKIHPIFNVALLKRYDGQCLLLNPILVDGKAEYKVE